MSETFGFWRALEHLEAGRRVAREGWNGKGMFVYLVPSASYPVQTGAAKAHFGEGSHVPYRAYLAIKTAQDDGATWAPSVGDALAKDWVCLDAEVAAPGFARYRSHKIVEAAEIAGFGEDGDGQFVRVSGIGVEKVRPPEGIFARGFPNAGDFLVRYNAGTPKEHLSWSPRDVFLDGYTRISED